MGYISKAFRTSTGDDPPDDALMEKLLEHEPGDAQPPHAPNRPAEPAELPDDPAAGADALAARAEPIEPIEPIDCPIDDRLVMVVAAESGHAEAYRRLASRAHAAMGGRSAVHAITSASRKEGKTITSANFAMAMAEVTQRRTVLIDGDLRAANLMRLFQGRADLPGLYQVLSGELDIDQVMVQPRGYGATIIPAGISRGAAKAPAAINADNLAAAIEALTDRFEQVVIDTPPVLDVADAGALCGVADQVLLVVRMNQTHRAVVHEAIATVRSYNQNIAGLVMTDVKPHDVPYGQRYMHRYYGHRRPRRHAGPSPVLSGSKP